MDMNRDRTRPWTASHTPGTGRATPKSGRARGACPRSIRNPSIAMLASDSHSRGDAEPSLRFHRRSSHELAESRRAPARVTVDVHLRAHRVRRGRACRARVDRSRGDRERERAARPGVLLLFCACFFCACAATFTITRPSPSPLAFASARTFSCDGPCDGARERERERESYARRSGLHQPRGRDRAPPAPRCRREESRGHPDVTETGRPLPSRRRPHAREGYRSSRDQEMAASRASRSAGNGCGSAITML